MTVIPQGLGKPVAHWLFSAKKEDETDIAVMTVSGL